MAELKVTLKRSIIGRPQNQRETVLIMPLIASLEGLTTELLIFVRPNALTVSRWF